MAQEGDRPVSFESDLPPAELRALRGALSSLESRLFVATIKKLRAYALVVSGVVGLCGLFLLTNLKQAVIEAASNRLASDEELRGEIVGHVDKQLQEASELTARLKQAAALLDEEQGRLITTLAGKLDEIHSMVAQLKSELEQPKG